MDIRLSIFPTSRYSALIAYTTIYKLRNRYANRFRVLLCKYSKLSDFTCPYCIQIGTTIRFLPYEDGRAFEELLNYYSHRETEGTIYED